MQNACDQKWPSTVTQSSCKILTHVQEPGLGPTIKIGPPRNIWPQFTTIYAHSDVTKGISLSLKMHSTFTGGESLHGRDEREYEGREDLIIVCGEQFWSTNSLQNATTSSQWKLNLSYTNLHRYEPMRWRLGVVVSVVGRTNEVNQHRARLVL